MTAIITKPGVYELPEDVWVGDVNAALNYFQPLPLDGDESLQDDTDYQQFATSN